MSSTARMILDPPPPLHTKDSGYNTLRLACLGEIVARQGLLLHDHQHDSDIRWDRDYRNGTLCQALTVKELRAFAQDEDTESNANPISRAHLTALPERADASSSLSPLFSLSAELRNQIYELALTGEAALERPTQPGVIRASRQLRYETLGLFLATNSLLLTLSHHIRGIPTDHPSRLELCTKDKAWIAALGPANLRHVQRIVLRIHPLLWDLAGPKRHGCKAIRVDFSDRMETVELEGIDGLWDVEAELRKVWTCHSHCESQMAKPTNRLRIYATRTFTA